MTVSEVIKKMVAYSEGNLHDINHFMKVYAYAKTIAEGENLNPELQKLVEVGNTVVVIEHNLDVIKTADHIIDLGPEGGDGGGTIVCTGTPEEVAACPESFTGQYLKKVLER